MKRVTEFETTDGTRFAERKAAEDHQFNIDLGASARALAAEGSDAQIGAALRLAYDIRRSRSERATGGAA